MKYDVFFLYKKKYVCAIEFDDVSHNNKTQNLEGFIYVNRPPADAKKNVLSSAMGIHLLRIWANDNRPNAKSKIGLVVRQFLRMVRKNKVTFSDNMVDFCQRVERFGRFNMKDGGLNPIGKWTPRKMLTTLSAGMNPTLITGFTAELNNDLGKIPISVVFDAKIPPEHDRRPDNELLKTMEKEGRKHPCMNYVIRIPRYIDPPTINGYYTFVKEWKKRNANPSIDFVVDPDSYRGRIMSTKKYGLAVIASATPPDQPNNVKGYRLESTNILPWKMPTLTLGQPSGLEEVKSIAKQFVRIIEPGTRPPGNPPGDECDYPGGDKGWKLAIFPKQRPDKKDKEDYETNKWRRDGAFEKKDEVRKLWPKGAHWARPGNLITFARPGRNAPVEINGYTLAGSFKNVEVDSIDLHGKDVWWIGVKHKGAEIHWIDQPNFEFVFRPDGVKDRQPLSEYVFTIPPGRNAPIPRRNDPDFDVSG